MALFRTLPTPTNDLLPRLMVEVCLVLAPDVNFFLIQDVHPSRWDVHLIEVNYCDDIRPEQQLARATEQYNGLKHVLARHCHKVSLHTILIGVMGTIYKCHTELPLSKLGLDRCRVRKLTLDRNTHSIQYATKIINTSRRLKNTKERTYGFFQNPPAPH